MSSDGALAPESPPDLNELVARLFQQHARSICAYLHSLVNDWELAHDLMQESYLRLHESRDRLPAIDNQRAWLYRIATNLACAEERAVTP